MSKIMKRVLIADDDADVALALARAVRSTGEHHVIVVYSGDEALAQLREQPADVLLSDIDMPGMDGVQLAASARSEGLAPVRIIMTGNARLETALAAINRGEVHRYLTKPWNTEELLRTLEESFARLDELARLSAADRVGKRLKEACAALEAEYPGVTQVAREDEVYVLEEASVAHGTAGFANTVLGQLLIRES